MFFFPCGRPPAADHKKNVLKNDVDLGFCIKTDVVFWIINVVTKSGNALFRHFELNVDSEAKFPLVYKSDKSRFKSRVPESTSQLTSNRGRLVPMVDQNGDKFGRF